MSELINNSQKRKELLKHLILQLHKGEAPDIIKNRLKELLKSIPYGEVVEVEQELINEGLPQEEVLQFCDVHTSVLEGSIDHSGAKLIPPGHPVDVFKMENRELEKVTAAIRESFEKAASLKDEQAADYFNELKANFNKLTDVEKHYVRKENLLFPFLEKNNITGPPKVMWGKHDETRGFLKSAIEALNAPGEISAEEVQPVIELVLTPAVNAVEDMIMKEEQILLPMSMDVLSESDWYDVSRQSLEIGYCLYDPPFDWVPKGVDVKEHSSVEGNTVRLQSGSFTPEEINAILNSLPGDITFVDKDDKVKYFSQGKERIFSRSRAILGRDVRMCHPPSSVHIVDKIVADFKSGKEDSAPFWIQMGGKFIHIEYFALRDEKGNYLGTLEFSQDLSEKRSLEGEQRLLSYSKKEGENE